MDGFHRETHRREPVFGLGGVCTPIVEGERKEENAACSVKKTPDLLLDVIEVATSINSGVADQQNSHVVIRISDVYIYNASKMRSPKQPKRTSLILLLSSLPAKRSAVRVALWRRLKKMGAAQLTTSTYLLPDLPAQHERFQWLAKQIRDSGGDSTLVRAEEIEGL